MRQKGSHVTLTKEGGRGLVTVPEGGRELDRGTFGSILRQAGMRRREFDEVAEEII